MRAQGFEHPARAGASNRAEAQLVGEQIIHPRLQEAQQPVALRLLAFVSQWRALGGSSNDPTASRLPRPATLRLQFRDLHEALQAARGIGVGFNPWSVAGLKRNEVRISKVLAALWNPTMCGPLAVEFLQHFLNQLRAGNNLPTANQLAQGYSVRTEHPLLGDKATRTDIFIQGRGSAHEVGFGLVVEIKVDAPEGRDGRGAIEPQFDRIRRHLVTCPPEGPSI